MATSTVVGASSALERCIKIDASDDGMFIPRPTITLKVEGTSLQLYPPADPSWKTAEKDYAFKVNVSACERACLTPLTSITHVSHQMGMTTQGNMEVATWTNPLKDHWANPSSASMRIIGYFDSSGNRIDDAEDANGNLKDIGDGVPRDDMRPPDITFVSFCFDHDYSDLTQLGIPQVHSKLVWVIPLPVARVVSTDVAGVEFSRVTFAVPGQISTMSEATFRSQVLNPLGTMGPVLLQPSTPPAHAILTDAHVMQKLQNILLRHAQPHIYAALRAVICPNFNTAPEATVMQVKQAYFDAAGNAQELSIVAYHQALISSATPFSDCTRWPYNVAQHFVNNLAPIIKTQYLAEYHDHNQMVDMGMVQQLQYLRTLLARLIQCERKLASSKVMIRGEISNHAMFVNHQPSGILLSQAEGTLQRHDRSSPAASPRKFESECWGCGAKGPNAHVYRDKATGKILCPHAHKPEVSQRAERMKNDFIIRRKARQSKYVKRSNVKFTDLTDSEKAVARAHFSAEAPELASVSTGVSSLSVSSPPGAAPPSYTLTLQVFHATSSHLPQLPVAISPTLPHILIQTGLLSDPVDICPQLRALYDSGASMSTANAGYLMPIIKANPHIVESIYFTKDGKHSPIIVGGIVMNDDPIKAMQTRAELNVVVCLRLRYKTRAEHRQLNHSIAIGKSVAVNLILGQPFIKGLQCILDSHSNTVNAQFIENGVFKVVDMVPQLDQTTIPHAPISRPSVNPIFADVIDRISTYYAGSPIVDSLIKRSSKRSINDALLLGCDVSDDDSRV